MAKNVMKMIKPSPNLGKNGFDLSHRQVFTANFGTLYPTLCIETVPNDKIKIKAADLLRAQPLVTPSFMRCKQHLDLWFVPYTDLWSRFNEFMVDKTELGSSALKSRDFIPHFSTVDLKNLLVTDPSQWSIPTLHTQYSNHREVCTILDLLGYSGTHIMNAQTNYPQVMLNPFRLAAYNYIWYREYRQQYYDDGTFGIPSTFGSNRASFLFNFDRLPCDSANNADITVYDQSNAILAAMIQPRYRLWKKDLFTGLMPSTQFGNVSLYQRNESTSNDVGRWSLNSSTSPMAGGVNISTVSSGNGLKQDSPAYGVQHDHGFITKIDVLAFRKSEAIQKWRENALRAGNQVQDNFEAHYGSKPHSHMIHHPVFIGSIDSGVNVGDVNATAQTGQSVNGVLGDVAGKMIGSLDGHEFTFETTDFGVIMGLYSILPEAEYNATQFDRMNCLLEREDFFIPEYENLGLEGVDQINITGNVQQSFVLGFAPRYWGYKTKLDRCCGELMNYQGFNGNLRQWCTPKYDVDSSINSAVPLSALYVNPYLFDVNFAIGVNNTDQMIVDMYNDVTAVRSMSVSGMPSY